MDSFISSGDLIIVHSGYSEIKNNCSDLKDPKEIIDGLLEIIGETGTIALPTHPEYVQIKVSKNTVLEETSNEILQFDPIKTKAWTGVLPNVFLGYDGVIRSKHPINTMAAKGPLAETMMKDNIQGDRPLPCGKTSSWMFCKENNAKIIGLGVDLVHSLTMIHVAEDAYHEEWPINDWYRDRDFLIVDGNDKLPIKVRERKTKWGTLFFAERNLRKDLIKDGILQVSNIGGIRFEYIHDSNALIEFLRSRNNGGYPYYISRKFEKPTK